MLSGYDDSQSNINLCVEFFVPLQVGHHLAPAKMSKSLVPGRTQWQTGIDPPSVEESFSRSADTIPKGCMMCLPYSNQYPASFCLEATECTD
jgi:hypothetical protein